MEAKKTLIKVSPSGISYLLECPRCLWLHFNEGVKRPRGAFPSLPDGMDNIFKNYFDEYRDAGVLPPEIEGKIDAKLYNDKKTLQTWREFHFGRGGIRASFPEIATEVSGAIDELLVSSDGKFIPFDFKTRGYPTKEDTHEHYRTQIDLYALLFEKNGHPVATHGYLLFFWPESYAMGTANFKTELVRMDVSSSRGYAALERAHKIITGPKPSAHKSCEYCLFRGVDET